MDESRLPLAAISDSELEQALIDLGRVLAYPVTPDLSRQVRVRLQGEISSSGRQPSPQPLSRLGGRGATGSLLSRRRREESGLWGWRQQFVWLAVACLLIAIVAGLAVFPDARMAIADRLGLRGLDIRWVEETPTIEPAPVGAPLLLGRPLTRDEAGAAVDFPILVPSAPGFANPREIYLSGQGDSAMISFVYPASPELPASDETGVGALLTQFQGDSERGLIEKGLVGDGDDPEPSLEAVTVNGEPGYWISGAPHGVFFICFDAGECREERYRLASDVLVWEQHGLTLRLESSLSRDVALAVAASVRPIE